MTHRVNLLPAAYRHTQRHRRRFRLALAAAGIVLATELVVGIVLHARAGQTRRLLADADEARRAAAAAKQSLDEPTRQAQRLERELMLAQGLRARHCWSKLLSVIAQAVPERVMVSSLSTDPPQWNPGLRGSPVSAGGAGTTAAASKRLVDGVVLSGHAVDHDDLSALMAGLHATGTFSSVDVKQARRDKFLDHDAILFELYCRW